MMKTQLNVNKKKSPVLCVALFDGVVGFKALIDKMNVSYKMQSLYFYIKRVESREASWNAININRIPRTTVCQETTAICKYL